MTKRELAGRVAARYVAGGLARALLGGLGLSVTGMAAADSPPDMQAVEQRFWDCDRASMQGRLDQGDAQACSLATERLRALRFNGDFEALLQWWRQHKSVQHALPSHGRFEASGRRN